MADRAADAPADRLHAFASGFQATFYVYTGVTTGLFEALTEPRTAAALADTCELHEPYVRQFCEAGLRWELLTVTELTGDAPAFRLDEDFVDVLAVPDAPEYMGGLFDHLGRHQSEDYRAYPRAFETGEERRFEGRDREFTEAIASSTRGLHDVFTDHLLSELSAFDARLSNGGRLVDAGCGAGRLVCRLVSRYPAVEAVGVDLDEDAVRLARERADAMDVADRTTFRVQDAATIDDAVAAAVFFMSLHEIPPAKRRELFEHLGDVLADDGVVVVFDEIYPDAYDQFSRAPFAAGVETQWAELTWGSAVPTSEQYRDLFAAAGCEVQTYRTVADRFIVYEGVIP
ncbi:MAG: cyclopropane-fatty-acyl-phospholipid synthase family protein [Haloglomus sp.]